MTIRRMLAFGLLFLSACAGEDRTRVKAMNKEHMVGGKTAGDVFSPELAKLARAACTGDMAGVEAAIRAGADPNGKGYEGVTPLIWAENCESIAGIEALLAAEADPNLRFGDTTPVCLAAGMDNPAILNLLLKHGGDPNCARPNSRWNALIIAFGSGMERKRWDNYYALLDAGADINSVHDGETIGLFAAGMHQYDKVAELLDRGYNVALDDLGYMAQQRLPGSPELTRRQDEWRLRVIEMLKARGVRFPVPA